MRHSLENLCTLLSMHFSFKLPMCFSVFIIQTRMMLSYISAMKAPCFWLSIEGHLLKSFTLNKDCRLLYYWDDFISPPPTVNTCRSCTGMVFWVQYHGLYTMSSKYMALYFSHFRRQNDITLMSFWVNG